MPALWAICPDFRSHLQPNLFLTIENSDKPGFQIPTVKVCYFSRIKMFAQQKVTLPKGRHKIIILDEADSMTEVSSTLLSGDPITELVQYSEDLKSDH